jgi:hypothetical protein
MSALGTAQSAAWYRHPWPWFLMIGPAIAVAAGCATLWLALRSDDGLVADDYYRRGLAVNHTLDRAARSAALGLSAEVTVDADGDCMVALHARDALPAAVRLRLIHPTRAGHDRSVQLIVGSDRRYHGRVPGFSPGRWLVSVEGDDWRLGPVEATGRALRVALASVQS